MPVDHATFLISFVDSLLGTSRNCLHCRCLTDDRRDLSSYTTSKPSPQDRFIYQSAYLRYAIYISSSGRTSNAVRRSIAVGRPNGARVSECSRHLEPAVASSSHPAPIRRPDYAIITRARNDFLSPSYHAKVAQEVYHCPPP